MRSSVMIQSKCTQVTVVILLMVWSHFAYTAHDKKAWTILVYIAAANDLNPFADMNVAEMMKVGSNSNVNILVYQTIHRKGQQKETRRLYINKGSVTQIGPTTQEDSGDINTFMKALAWAAEYPSDGIVVNMWDHGSGGLNRRNNGFVRGICYDFDTRHYFTDRDVRKALTWARDTFRAGKKFDIITCDACLMGGVEFAYTIADCADYFVASEEVILAYGYDYETLLQPVAHGPISARELACWFVESYGRAYAGVNFYTLSALDTQYLPSLADNINAVAQVLQNGMKGVQKARIQDFIYQSVGQATHFHDDVYVDLGTVYNNLKDNATQMGLTPSDVKLLLQHIKEGQSILSELVIEQATSLSYKNVSGISIYFPQDRIDKSYYNLYWTQYNRAWLEMLQMYMTG